ncbi:Ger(x)C family spore germination protein [Paenibacillus gorillae]|uniref:Ger(x)C family spore germination protein n=1 Tax=Paenibacillus gorillae TaxID=1243662 RepID=UPI0004B1703D|nr:Ger(x)C family spore germination protein [Paenibacillus gorillae]
MSSLKFIGLFILTVAALFIGGCDGGLELNEIHIVHAIAIDKGEHAPIRLTAEISKIVTGGQQPKGMQSDSFFLSHEGENVFEAARLMRNKSDRMLLWGHTSVILFSKDVMKDGLSQHVESIRRLRQFRNSTLLYMTEGKAYEKLQMPAPNLMITSQVLKGLAQNGKANAMTMKVTLIDVYRDYINEFRDIAIPAILRVKDSEDDKLILQATGLFIFEKDHLAGKLSPGQTRAFMRANNRMAGSLEKIPCGSGKEISFENINNNSKMHVTLDSEQKPQVSFNITADLTITDLPCEEFDITPAMIHAWEDQLNEKIAEDIRKFIRYTQKRHTDLLGVGEWIHRKHPQIWRTMKENWPEQYSGIQPKIEVHTRIDHSNFIT